MEIKKLTPAKITSLWNSYLTNTMALWLSRYFISKTQDEELHSILEYAEKIAMIEVEKSKSFLEEAKHPLPQNFGNDDVNVNAPALVTDNFTLMIKYNLAQTAHFVYSLSLSTSTRKDIRQLIKNVLKIQQNFIIV